MTMAPPDAVEKQRAYRIENCEKIRGYQAAWRARNRERIEVYETPRRPKPVSGHGQSVTLIRTIRVSEHGTSAIVRNAGRTK